MSGYQEFQGIDPTNPPKYQRDSMRLTKRALLFIISDLKRKYGLLEDNAPGLGGQPKDNSPMLGGDRRITPIDGSA